LFKSYYQLTKPGIIYGNLLTAAAGFLLASQWHIHYVLLLATLGGTALVIASACVFNNYIDRGIDRKMARTKERALVAGTICGRNALMYASILGICGFAVLALRTNRLTLIIGGVAFIVYIAAYGIAKRRSVHGTIIGSIAGAAPVVAGYCAVTDHFGAAAITLFCILVTWQMPHFYAIAMYRFNDYKSAGLPVLPVYKDIHATKIQMVLYIAIFIVALALLPTFTQVGYTYLIVTIGVSFFWLYKAVRGFSINEKDTALWARHMFLISLVVIMAVSLMLAVGPLLP
jgi:protoheme IX farnesyltransferase